MAYGKPNSSGNLTLWIVGGLFALVAVSMLILRLTRPGPDEGAGGDAGEDGGDAVAVVVPEDAGYPDPPTDGEWETDALDEDTYIQVTAESTCAAQRFHGPPEELTVEMDRIYYHYKTTSTEVAGFAAQVNADDTHAIRVGERIAAAIERCP